MLNRRTFFVREHVSLLKLKDTYDILDPETQQLLGQATEATPKWVLGLRLLINKGLMPLQIEVRETGGEAPVLRIARGWSFWRSKVYVTDAQENPLGYFKSKLFSLGGGFLVYNAHDVQVADVKGNWKGWDFKFISTSGEEIGTVTKKWAGLGKELFTSADNYLIAINDAGEAQESANALLLAAGLAIDIVFKEKKG